MYISTILPNKKVVDMKEILFKDLRGFALYDNLSLSSSIEFLESFIITSNLNITEKMHSFLNLREMCVGENISVPSKKGNVNVSLDHIKNNIRDFDDIEEIITLDGVEYTLNYPFKFNTGNSDFIFSCITKIKLDKDEEPLILSTLAEIDYKHVIDSIPKEILNNINDFIEKNSRAFNITILEARESLGIKKIEFNIFSSQFTQFIVSLFNCIGGSEYRDLLFILCKRIPDVSFLMSCTYLEIEDYYNLYKEEAEKINELQNQN